MFTQIGSQDCLRQQFDADAFLFCCVIIACAPQHYAPLNSGLSKATPGLSICYSIGALDPGMLVEPLRRYGNIACALPAVLPVSYLTGKLNGALQQHTGNSSSSMVPVPPRMVLHAVINGSIPHKERGICCILVRQGE